MSIRRIILVYAGLYIGITLSAQEGKFTASAPSSVQVGQQFQYTVQGDQQGQVQLPDLDGFEILAGPYTSFSSSTQWVNGKMKATTTASYTYILRAGKSGDLTIAPAKVKVNREVYETNPVLLSVKGTGASTGPNGTAGTPGNGGQSATAGDQPAQDAEQPVFLRVNPSKTNVYVGEQFVSELKVYTSVNTRPTAGMKEIPYEGFYKHALEADQVASRENINGQVHVTQVLQRHVLIPQKAGKLVIEPYESEWAIPQRVNRSRQESVFDQFFDDPFSDPFFDRVQNVPVMLATKPLTINVKPLPEGAPEGFTGGVGDLRFSAKLTNDLVTVNDALSLVVTITGTGNISLIGAPKIDFPPDHDIYETNKSVKISTEGNRVSGTVTFEYPVVARHAGNFRIPPVVFSWFDPATGKYESTKTPEFVFSVEKGESTEEVGQIFVPGTRGEQVENIGTDILDISYDLPEFTHVGKTPLNNLTYWLAYLVLLLLFVVLSIILGIYFKQKADIRLSRNRKANRMARKRLKVADKARKSGDKEKFFEEIEKALWGYLADKLSIELSTLSRERVRDILEGSGVSHELYGNLTRILEESEFSRYAPTSEKSDMDSLYAETIHLVNKLEQNIRSK